ncbi:MAG: dUTP diphosphatase [Patescibacteria group bacterium]
MLTIKVKKIDPRAKLPSYAIPGDAGLDLFALEDFTVPAGKYVSGIRTGVALAIPDDYVGLCWDKSGLAANHGIKVMAGVIDSGYRGELLLTLLNTSEQDYHFKAGDKVMQLLIQPIQQVEVVEADNLPSSERAQGGFGSTGK